MSRRSGSGLDHWTGADGALCLLFLLTHRLGLSNQHIAQVIELRRRFRILKRPANFNMRSSLAMTELSLAVLVVTQRSE
jgi:hypothetical protein